MYVFILHIVFQAVFLDSVNSIDVDDLFNSPNKVYLQVQNEYQDVKVSHTGLVYEKKKKIEHVGEF